MPKYKPPHDLTTQLDHLSRSLHNQLQTIRFHGHLTPIRTGRHTHWSCITGDTSKTRWDQRPETFTPKGTPPPGGECHQRNHNTTPTFRRSTIFQKRSGTARFGGDRISLSRSMCSASAISSSESRRALSLVAPSCRAASASALVICFTVRRGPRAAPLRLPH